MSSILWRLFRKLLFFFDAERVHHLTLKLIQALRRCGPYPLRLLSGTFRAPIATTRVFGLEFGSPVGLAAGFDKNAEILTALPDLGFGFAEIGTVTPRPQAGNERPRLFRDAKTLTLFNRMGFNNLGAAIVAERLLEARNKLPTSFRVGVNLGKNKEASLSEAPNDYAQAAKYFEGLADYLVINVSSPNTPGLRDLQSIELLRPIVLKMVQTISSWRPRPPLLLKLAPELVGEDLVRLVQNAESWGIDGWVLTNTQAGNRQVGAQVLGGGWSGSLLAQISRDSLVRVRKSSRLPIISVGGILDAEEAALRYKLGANLVQIYSGWIFGGPGFPAKLARRLSRAQAI